MCADCHCVARTLTCQGDTYEKVNDIAEKRWHLERARIIVSIENEMTAEKRLRVKSSSATVINSKLYLQAGNYRRLSLLFSGTSVPPGDLQVGQG